MPSFLNARIRAERMQALSDAMLSIIGTIMAIPIATLSEQDVERAREDGVLWLVGTRMQMAHAFYMTFLFITLQWVRHSVLLSRLGRVSVVTLSINIVLLLAAGFLPFTIIVSRYYSGTGAVALFPTTAALYELINTGMVFSATREFKPGRITALELRHIRCSALLSLALMVLGCAVIIGARVASDAGGIITTSVWPFIPLLGTRLSAAYFNRYHPDAAAQTRQHNGIVRGWRFHHWLIPRQRAEAFCDGVFAIAATFIVLEIRPRIVQQQSAVTLAELLDRYGADLISFAVAFLLIAVLWTEHHHVLSMARGLWPGAFTATTGMLWAVALLPFGTSLLMRFPGSKVSGTVCLAALLIASTWLFTLYFHLSRSKANAAGVLLHPDKVKALHAFNCLRLLVLPLVSALALLVDIVVPVGYAPFVVMLVGQVGALVLYERAHARLSSAARRPSIALHSDQSSDSSSGSESGDEQAGWAGAAEPAMLQMGDARASLLGSAA